MLEKCILLLALGQLAILSPGPDFLLIVRNSARYSLRNALATVAGVNLGLSVHLSYAVWIVTLAQELDTGLQLGIRTVGCLYLMYLGVRCLKSSGTAFQHVGSSDRVSFFRAFREGLLCNVLNPKVAAFMVSLLAQFIETSSPTEERVLYALLLLGQSIAYWTLLVCVVQKTRVRNVIAYYGRAIDRVFGCVLVIFAVEVLLA